MTRAYTLKAAIAAADAKQVRRNVADEATVRFDTLPPSENRLFVEIRAKTWKAGKWVPTVRRIKTKDYAAWCDTTLAHVLKVQRPPLVQGDVRVSWLFETNRRMDLPNLFKAAFDMLTRCGVIEDDQRVIGGDYEWSPDITGAVARIRKVDTP